MNKLATISSLTLALALVSVISELSIQDAHAENKLRTERGHWDFDGDVDIDFQRDLLRITLANRSTDDSYNCSKCRNGCGSALIDWEVWSPDAGLLDSGTVRFTDVCNGSSERKFEQVSIPSKINVIDMRWNVTTPNGGHSFHKSRRTARRR